LGLTPRPRALRNDTRDIQGAGVRTCPFGLQARVSKVEKEKLNIQSDKLLTKQEYAEILAITTQAFERDYTPYMQMFKNPTHITGRVEGKLVSYVAIITRWVQIVKGPLLKAAAIEGMATEISRRHKGFATQLMRHAVKEAEGYEIAVLSTGRNSFYARLGWKLWQGPTLTRKGKELIDMPEERGCVMVCDLPKTPPYDITAPISIEWRELEPW
jgi:aminoglycoside 2'-N-acetyltransferase I